MLICSVYGLYVWDSLSLWVHYPLPRNGTIERERERDREGEGERDRDPRAANGRWTRKMNRWQPKKSKQPDRNIRPVNRATRECCTAEGRGKELVGTNACTTRWGGRAAARICVATMAHGLCQPRRRPLTPSHGPPCRHARALWGQHDGVVGYVEGVAAGRYANGFPYAIAMILMITTSSATAPMTAVARMRPCWSNAQRVAAHQRGSNKYPRTGYSASTP